MNKLPICSPSLIIKKNLRTEVSISHCKNYRSREYLKRIVFLCVLYFFNFCRNALDLRTVLNESKVYFKISCSA